jgi:hypothetical protein
LINGFFLKTTTFPWNTFPQIFQVLFFDLINMKVSSTTALLLFTSSFASAWKFRSDAQEFTGVTNQLCFSLTHRGAELRNVKYYSWDRGFMPPGARPLSQESCCLVLYDTDTCKREGNNDRICKREVAGESVLNKVEGFRVEGCNNNNTIIISEECRNGRDRDGRECRRECRDREGRECRRGRDCRDREGRECRD